MIRKPIFAFKDTTETDIDLVPLYGIMLIEDAGSGKPNLIQITDMTGITSSTTIAELLVLTNQYTMVYSGGMLDADTLDTLHAVSFVRADDNTQMNVGRGVVYFEDNINDNDSGAGVTVKTSSDPTGGTNGSIFSVRSASNEGRLWVGQDVTSPADNDFHVGGIDANGYTTSPLKILAVDGSITTSGAIETTNTIDCEDLDVNGDFRITNYNPSEGQILSWNVGENSYMPVTPTSGVTTLVALSDTDISSPSTGQILSYNSVSGDWLNSTPTWADLSGDNTWTNFNTFDAEVHMNAELDMNDNELDDVRLIKFYGLYDNGTKSANWTLTSTNAQYQKVSMSDSCTVSITEPTGPCTIYLHLYQTSTSKVLTLPSGEWANGVVKTNTGTSGGHDLIMMHYTGAGWVFDMIQNLS